MRLRLSTALLLFSVCLLPALAMAHYEKQIDLNGGHFDNGGYYHCHNPGCDQHAPRHAFISRQLTNRDRDLFYLQEDWPYWLNLSGCKTARTVVLESTSLIPVTYTNPRQCEIREGLWIDAYTGEELTRAAQLEVDHIIPPVYANASNGYQWDYNTRAQFSNDLLNLIPVSRGVHRKKRQRGINAWRPRQEFLCEYAQSWQDISDKYDLDLFGRDRSRVKKILASCDTESQQSIDEED